MERTNKSKISKQLERKTSRSNKKKRKSYTGDTETMISTGSTLLDLAISGGRVRGGGLPAGILVEIFGPSGSGKTVMLSEIAGTVQRAGGDVLFHDPEARLNKQFASIFDLKFEKLEYSTPNTVPEVFKGVREWKPQQDSTINGIFADSLAALSTDMEMEKDVGDKMGMRRAKEFSEELRKTCRVLASKSYLMVCSNQVRQNLDAGPYGQKYKSPGGESFAFYASLRLRTLKPEKIKREKKVSGKKVSRVIGVRIQVEVFKSSIWKPHRTAPITIDFDYGIDDIRENLQFIKDFTKNTTYSVADESLDRSMDKAIKIVEKRKLEDTLKDQVIDLWEEIEIEFDSNRKKKRR